MGWVQCIHGKTVGMRAAVEDGARPECLDCEELEAFRRLEAQVRRTWPYNPCLEELDSIRARRGSGALGACTCTVPEDRARIAKAEGKLGTYTDLDPHCPQHGNEMRCTCLPNRTLHTREDLEREFGAGGLIAGCPILPVTFIGTDPSCPLHGTLK
jgi:hypothetical protein